MTITNNFTQCFASIKDEKNLYTAIQTFNKQLAESAFATVKDAQGLKAMAQEMVNGINEAFKARVKELAPAKAKAEKKPKTTTVALNVNVSGTGTRKESKPKTDKEPKAKKEQVKQVLVSELSKGDIKKLGIKFQQYSEKAVFLTGDTRCIKDQIKTIGGGHWNHARQGWFLKNDSAKTLADAMNMKIAAKA